MKLFSSFRKEKKEKPVVYQLGWWAHQHLLEIHSFDVVVLESKLNLLNNKSLIAYTVKGTLKEGVTGIPFIKYVHHSEQLLKTSDEFTVAIEDTTADACISITPVVEIENTSKRAEAPVEFEFTNQYWLQSLRWGNNRLSFICGAIQREITLEQRK